MVVGFPNQPLFFFPTEKGSRLGLCEMGVPFPPFKETPHILWIPFKKKRVSQFASFSRFFFEETVPGW